MIKKILFLLSLCVMANMPMPAFCDDDMSFDDFSIMDDSGADVDVDQQITLNSGSTGINVKQFDLAGAMLGMTYDEINNLFFNSSSLYAPVKNNSVVYTINKEWKYNLDYECRQNNIFIPDQLEKCIYSMARNRGLLYVSEIHLERSFTGETLDIYFTSNATDNQVWKIVYKNDVDKMEGDAEKFENQREKKILAFWSGVLDKFGEPNAGEDKWASSENAYEPMMQAYYGELVLTDNGLMTTDSSENVQSARENFQAKPYAF